MSGGRGFAGSRFGGSDGPCQCALMPPGNGVELICTLSDGIPAT